MINIPMYWLLIEAVLGGAIALILHEIISRIMFARVVRRIPVRRVSEEEMKQIAEQIRKSKGSDRESDL